MQMDLQRSRKGDSAARSHHFSCYGGLRIRETENIQICTAVHWSWGTDYSCVSCLAGFVLYASSICVVTINYFQENHTCFASPALQRAFGHLFSDSYASGKPCLSAHWRLEGLRAEKGSGSLCAKIKFCTLRLAEKAVAHSGLWLSEKRCARVGII